MTKKISKTNKKIFWGGLAYGLFGGIIGNILVNSCFVFITESYKSNIGFLGNLIILIFSFILFGLISYHIVKEIDKNF